MSDLALLAQADLLLLACDLLRRPSEALKASLPAPAAVGELIAASTLPEPRGLADTLAAALDQAAQTPLEAWSDEFHRLFEGAMACPPNQTAYIRRDKGAILADLRGFYEAFGFAPRRDTGEKPDHILFELEFLAMALVMLAGASRAGDQEKRSVTIDAMRKFSESHLGDWIESFAQQLAGATGLPLYVAVAMLLGQLWRGLSAAHSLHRAADARPADASPGAPDWSCPADER